MRIRSALGGVLIALPLVMTSAAGAAELTVAAANSTCGVMREVGALFTAREGVAVHYLCKSSGRLAKGLKGRAIEADLFLSANRRWMQYMEEAGMVEVERVESPWSNSLVVAADEGSPLRLDDWREVAEPKVARVMIGDPGTAPFGRYAKQAMEAAEVWRETRGKIETKKHISLLASALTEAEEGSVGFLYRTNVIDGLRVLAAVEPSWHDPIRYYLAPVGEAAARPEVAAFLELLRGDEAGERFVAAGFGRVAVERNEAERPDNGSSR